MKQINLFNCRGLRWGVAALLLLAVSVAANAYDFKVGSIYYNILSSSGKTCEVTYRNSSYNSYSGTVVIPETVKYNGTTYTVTTIGKEAFRSSTGLTEIIIPESVTSIGDYAFRNCTGLIQVNFNAIACTSSKMSSFSGCTSLSIVNIGDNVTIIPAYLCYKLTGLTSVTMGNSVGSIGSSAFDCEALVSITSLNPKPPTCNSGVFHSVDKKNCVLYVPEGSGVLYAASEEWTDFYNIVEIDVSPVADILANCSAEAVGYYTLDGKQVPSLQRGINIIRYFDGTTKKVLIK